MRPDVIRTQVFVPQDEAFGLGPGVDAVVRVPEIPNRTFPGKVTRIATALQPSSRTPLTEIDVPNPDGALNPGIYCTVELLSRARHHRCSYRPMRSYSIRTACMSRSLRTAPRICRRSRSRVTSVRRSIHPPSPRGIATCRNRRAFL
jgi:hypothetical protein